MSTEGPHTWSQWNLAACVSGKTLFFLTVIPSLKTTIKIVYPFIKCFLNLFYHLIPTPCKVGTLVVVVIHMTGWRIRPTVLYKGSHWWERM